MGLLAWWRAQQAQPHQLDAALRDIATAIREQRWGRTVSPTVCIQCSLKALLAREPAPAFDETPEEHIKRVHPNEIDTQRERQRLMADLSRQLQEREREAAMIHLAMLIVATVIVGATALFLLSLAIAILVGIVKCIGAVISAIFGMI